MWGGELQENVVKLGNSRGCEAIIRLGRHAGSSNDTETHLVNRKYIFLRKEKVFLLKGYSEFQV